MEFLRNAIYTSLRTAPRAIGKLFRGRKPDDGDEAARRLTERVMHVLEDYEMERKPMRSGWTPDEREQDQ